ncbi:ABC transporter permease [Wenzhouxiangella sp. EGI_FJ10305]|uniref:ABC transporter permease n=1 Tax=Wenzhouxiangella sp. EGI_FJ10305 TaxID=3243768 RepID=UPI0035D954B4
MQATAEALHRRLWPRADRRWLIGPLLLLVGIPLLMLLTSWAQPQPEIWQHLSKYLLPRLIGHTALMMVIVGIGVAVLGVGLAWLSACCEYPLRRMLDPLLVLPLAFPTYVLAFIYLGMLDYAGPVQTLWRDLFGSSPALLEAISRPGGVLFILVLAFYPYVYLLARAAFLGGGLAAFEASRSLGQGPVRTFFRVSLPMARPALAAGLALALMETLADFGAVSIYGFDTFTTAIYRTWLGMFNLTAAVQLASILMLFVFLLLGVERLSRSSRVSQAERRPTGHRIRLAGARGWLATALQLAVLLVAVVLPLIQLLVWAWPQMAGLLDTRLVRVVFNTMALGFSGAMAVVLGGVLLLVATNRASKRQQLLGEVAALGYAIPGTVLAVAIMLAFLRFDQLTGTTLAGGMIALVLAYLIRFLRVAWGPLDSVAGRIRPQYVEVARSLGVPRWYRLWRVNLPLLWPGLITAFLLALVEVAKEMPATLMLRPFGWETLAVRIYELTAEGQWEMAAVPALILVLLGAIPVAVLIRSGRVRAI